MTSSTISINSLVDKYLKVRKQTERIVQPLEAEDFVCQPVVEVSPPKWHLAHTTWFFENFILAKFYDNYNLFNKDFNYLFNSYYNSQGKRILRNNRGTLSRPSTSIIYEYRSYVDHHLSQLLSDESKLNDELLHFLSIGINHEQQHQELLLTDIKYILGSNPLLPIYREFDVYENKKKPDFDWLNVEEGQYTIGYSGDDFHFDNEEGEHRVYLSPYSCANRLVTNGEYMDFIKDGAYQRPELWLSDAWDWLKEFGIRSPMYWFERNGEWFCYRLDGKKEIDTEESLVHVSFYEADAFARWKNCRLLTEQEWETAAKIYGTRNAKPHFVEQEVFHPQIARDYQFFGTAWEWTNSAYLAYPGYHQEEGALGEYNGKFMINQMVLRGGSLATPESHFRPSYRNFFQANHQWQFSGIRLAKNT